NYIHIFFQKFSHMLKKKDTGNTLILWICIRKMSSDIPKSRCSQQGIHNSMDYHICIRVPQQSLIPGDIHSPQDQVSSLCQFMDVISHSNPYHSLSPTLQIRLRIRHPPQLLSGLLCLQNPEPQHRLPFFPDLLPPLHLQYHLRLLSLLPGSEGTSYLRSSLYTYSFPPYYQPLL